MKLHSFKDKVPAKSDFPIWAYFTQGNGGWSSFVYCAGFDDVWPDFWTHWVRQADVPLKPTQTPDEILKAQAAPEPDWVWEYLKVGDIIQQCDVYTNIFGTVKWYDYGVGKPATAGDCSMFKARRKCWRQLQLGEVIQQGDQYLAPTESLLDWYETNDAGTLHLLSWATYRRRIAPSPAPAVNLSIGKGTPLWSSVSDSRLITLPPADVTLHLTSGATVKNGGEEINLDGATKPVRVLLGGDDLVAKVEHQRAELARQGEQLNEISGLIAGAGFFTNKGQTIVSRLKALIEDRKQLAHGHLENAVDRHAALAFQKQLATAQAMHSLTSCAVAEAHRELDTLVAPSSVMSQTVAERIREYATTVKAKIAQLEHEIEGHVTEKETLRGSTLHLQEMSDAFRNENARFRSALTELGAPNDPDPEVRLRKLVAARCDQESVKALQATVDDLQRRNKNQCTTIESCLMRASCAHQVLTDYAVPQGPSLEERIDILGTERDAAKATLEEIRQVLPTT